MATVQSLTKDRLLEIEAAGITSATISGSNHLILTKHDGTTLDSGLLPGGSTSINGLVKGNGSSFVQAISGTDYVLPTGNITGSCGYLNNSFIIKADTGITQGIDLYTFDGSSGKTLDIKAGTNITISKSSGSWTINSSSGLPTSTATNDMIYAPAPGAWARTSTGSGVVSALALAVTGSGGLVLGTTPSISSPSLTGTTTIAASNTTSPFTIQPTPTAKSAAATLTIAELLTYVITTAGSATFALTLPTGTLTDAGIQSGALPVNGSFDWFIVNTVAFTVTITAGTAHTYVGNATVAVNSSAQFRTRKTATNTFVTYRIG